MGRKGREKKERRKRRQDEINMLAGLISWQDAEGVHFVAPGLSPSPEQVAEMTKEYQNRIRQSPMWDDMVKQFGLKRAEELLKECKVKITPGPQG